MSHAAEYQLLGLVGHIMPSALGASPWIGPISALQRVKRKEITEAQIRAALTPAHLDQYFVAADQQARTRCIDGRPPAEPHSYARPFGAQVPGGTATAALCWRVASWGSMFTEDFTLSSDIKLLGGMLHKLGFATGGHVSDHAAPGSTGCGAIDKIPEILQSVTTPESQGQVRGLLKLLIGEAYDREITDAVVGRLVSLQAKKNEYFDRDPQSGSLQYREEAIKALKAQKADSVEKLTGDHHEVALVVNAVPHTTLDRDRFAADNDNKLQLFNYDFWRSLEVAEQLFAIGVTLPAAEAAVLQRQRQRYITARALFAIGTVMALTDGSLELIVRT